MREDHVTLIIAVIRKHARLGLAILEEDNARARGIRRKVQTQSG